MSKYEIKPPQIFTPSDEMHKKEDHKKLIGEIRRSHGETMRKVRTRFGQEAKPFFVDKGQ